MGIVKLGLVPEQPAVVVDVAGAPLVRFAQRRLAAVGELDLSIDGYLGCSIDVRLRGVNGDYVMTGVEIGRDIAQYSSSSSQTNELRSADILPIDEHIYLVLPHDLQP